MAYSSSPVVTLALVAVFSQRWLEKVKIIPLARTAPPSNRVGTHRDAGQLDAQIVFKTCDGPIPIEHKVFKAHFDPVFWLGRCGDKIVLILPRGGSSFLFIFRYWIADTKITQIIRFVAAEY